MAGRFSSPFKAASVRQLLETATAGMLLLNTNTVMATPFPYYACPAQLIQLFLTATDLNKGHWERMATSTCR